MLTLSFATGTEPDKWFHRYTERTNHGGLETSANDDPLGQVLAGKVVLGLVRLPDARLDDQLHRVKLYEEQLGIALPKEHTLSLLDTLNAADLADEIINYRADTTGYIDPADIRPQLQVVAANVGTVIAPRPLLKALSGKQIEHRKFVDPTVAPTTIALVWWKDNDSDAVQDFVGIAKGRTLNSSRSSTSQKKPTQPAKTPKNQPVAKRKKQRRRRRR